MARWSFMDRDFNPIHDSAVIKNPVRLYTRPNAALTLDGMQATLGSTVASIHKATAKDGIDIFEMLETLSKVLDRHDMSASSIKHYTTPNSYLQPIDAFSGFTVLVENWCSAKLGFAFKDSQFAFGIVHVKLNSGLFSSSDRKRAACKNDMLDAVRHFCGPALDVSRPPSGNGSSHLFYRSDQTLCTVVEENNKGLMNSTSKLHLTIYDREFWDPSMKIMRSIIGA